MKYLFLFIGIIIGSSALLFEPVRSYYKSVSRYNDAHENLANQDSSIIQTISALNLSIRVVTSNTTGIATDTSDAWVWVENGSKGIWNPLPRDYPIADTLNRIKKLFENKEITIRTTIRELEKTKP